ncbi:MAG TPA: carbon storage regulator CsrA [Phycisphaerae bacterium]|nr:carbon storage regulator CsrA [Phycisphaerae bacterium]
MLVMSRTVGEKVKIGQDITVLVIGVKGDKVRLGIEAPDGVAVHREEIFQALQRQKSGPSVKDDGTPPREDKKPCR